MADINTGAVPYALNEEGMKILEELRNFPVPEVVKKCEKVADFANVGAEDMPQFLPQIFKNDFAMAEKIANTGRAVIMCANEIGSINRKLGLVALGLGALAAGGGYLYLKLEKQQKEINDLRNQIMIIKAHQQY